MKTIDEMTDIVELQAWAKGTPMTLSAIKENLESALDAEDSSEAETIAQQILDTFAERQKMLGVGYPFKTDGSKLEISHPAPESTTYLFCLGLSLLPPAEIQNEQRSIQFETIVMNAAKAFFGGVGLRIGAPWRTESIPDYATLLDKVIELVPNLGKKMKIAAPEGGDAGWDILIVRNFCDNLIPRFVALGNCATGRTDWKRKGIDAQPTLFWSYFFQSDLRSVFLTFFAVPFLMDEDARLRKLSPMNMTFDRLRLCEYAPLTQIEDAAVWLKAQRANALGIPIN
jgi:hypothetical protein